MSDNIIMLGVVIIYAGIAGIGTALVWLCIWLMF